MPQANYSYIVLLALVMAGMISSEGAAESKDPRRKFDEEKAAREVVEAVFGPRIRAAIATSPIDDDRLVVREMLQHAWDSTADVSLTEALHARVDEMCGDRGEMIDLSAESQRILVSRSTRLRPAALKRLVSIEQSRFERSKGEDRQTAGWAWVCALIEAGDDAVERGEFSAAVVTYDAAAKAAVVCKDTGAQMRSERSKAWAQWRREMQERIDALTPLLEKGGDQKAIRSAVTLAVLEMDAALDAKPLIAALTDRELARIASLSLVPIKQLKEDESRLLAQWFGGQAAGLKGISQGNALRSSIRSTRQLLALKPHDAEGKALLDRALQSLAATHESPQLFNGAQVKHTLHEWLPNTNPAPKKLLHNREGFAVISGIGGWFGGHAELLKVGLSNDHYWYLAGRGANDSARGDSTSYHIASGEKPSYQFTPLVRTFRWRKDTPDLPLIRQRDGFCFLSHIQGRFGGAGEKVDIVLREDGWWCLSGRSVQPDVIVEATTIRLDRPDSFTSAIQKHVWRPGGPRVRLIHQDRGLCALSGVQGNLQGGGEYVRLRVDKEGFWYFEGTSGQDSLVISAFSIPYDQ